MHRALHLILTFGSMEECSMRGGIWSALLPSVSASHGQALERKQHRAPSPILCGHGWVQARPDLLGTHMAAGTNLLFSRVRQLLAQHRSDRREEWKMRGWIIVSVLMAKMRSPCSDFRATCCLQKTAHQKSHGGSWCDCPTKFWNCNWKREHQNLSNIALAVCLLGARRTIKVCWISFCCWVEGWFSNCGSARWKNNIF